MELHDPAEVGVNGTALGAVDNFVETALAKETFPRPVVLASRHRKLFYRRAWGTIARPDGSMRDLTPDLRQAFFSFSKGIATTVCCACHASGLFDWNDPVEGYIPGYACKGKEGTVLRHLVTHSAGIPTPCPTLADENDWDEAIAQLCDAEAEFPPGSATAYHPISGHLLAGEVCKRVTGRSFTDLSSELLNAIGATRTELRPPAGHEDMAVVPAPGTEGPTESLVSWQPGAGYIGPPENILRVLHLHLDRGAGIVDWRSLSGMHTLQFREQIDAGLPGFQSFGLGWVLGYNTGNTAAWGAWNGLGTQARPDTFGHAGFSTVLGIGDPERDCAIAICLSKAPVDGNGPSHALVVAARTTITDVLLGACEIL